MNALKSKVVHTPQLHTHAVKGAEAMDPRPSKAFQFGNTTVIIHSPLALMSENEQREWYRREWEAGNPVLKQIVQAAVDCLKK